MIMLDRRTALPPRNFCSCQREQVSGTMILALDFWAFSASPVEASIPSTMLICRAFSSLAVRMLRTTEMLPFTSLRTILASRSRAKVRGRTEGVRLAEVKRSRAALSSSLVVAAAKASRPSSYPDTCSSRRTGHSAFRPPRLSSM